jgi:hypothetical protein
MGCACDEDITGESSRQYTSASSSRLELFPLSVTVLKGNVFFSMVCEVCGYLMMITPVYSPRRTIFLTLDRATHICAMLIIESQLLGVYASLYA